MTNAYEDLLSFYANELDFNYEWHLNLLLFIRVATDFL